MIGSYCRSGLEGKPDNLARASRQFWAARLAARLSEVTVRLGWPYIRFGSSNCRLGVSEKRARCVRVAAELE